MLLLLAVPFLAGAGHPPEMPPVLDVGAVPDLATDTARAEYRVFLVSNLPRAFALSPSGVLGWSAGNESPEAARAAALASCARKGAADCALYAVGLDVVWPDRVWHAPPPPGPLIETINYDFVPDDRFLWRGPAKATGVYVWAVGKARGGLSETRGVQPPPLVRWLNNAGYDVVRFDRQPMADSRDRASGWLREGLAALRRSGYARVIVGGQSRGAWNALQMVDTPGLAEAIVALAPAAHGLASGSNLLGQTDDFRAMLAAASPQTTRVVLALFDQDPFIGDEEALVRLTETRLRPKVAALLVLDRPDGFAGHGAGVTAAFGRRFGKCIARFVTGEDSAVPASC